MKTYQHQAVLLEEAVSSLRVRGDGNYLDATFGRGGHSRAIMAKLTEQGRLYTLDKDPQAVAAGLAEWGDDPRFSIVQGSFAEMDRMVREWQIERNLDGILLDLGVSSPQLDDPERGFSFRNGGPLDMRMDPTTGVSAAEWLAETPEREMSRVFWEFGEERHARRIARSIVNARQQQPLETTTQLAELIESTIGKHEKKHPATRCFQAIRIVVNDELGDLASGLDAAIRQLRPGGRLVAISFHSLEDRLVKRTFREAARPGRVRRNIPAHPDWSPRLKLIGKAIRPSEQEISANPRARSAIMRVAEKIGSATQQE
ncbi:MAG: 16S rRNA (cytosine(1402)-N(4))-methyltransferase RsmH [Xanthomonadales bacterium]|nr:16S rRNA (cytosine(1402)-N(4))-methyltransferase RsmH [Gammaproteobacteria bacterium]NNK04962.1 16S rRNA (cytosine(1402)-N(4))-methyltransferase RsmH [Xanthomonadales bacterium]